MTQLLEQFDFLKDARFEKKDIGRVFAKKSELLSLTEVSDMDSLKNDSTLIAKAMLEEAWNAFIEFNAENAAVFKALLAKTNPKTDEILLVSDSNASNLNYIVAQMKKQNHPLAISWASNTKFLDLTQDAGIFLADSPGKFHLFSSHHQSGVFRSSEGTPGMIEKLRTDLGKDEKLVLISQYSPDRDTASELGIDATSIYSSVEDFNLLYGQHDELFNKTWRAKSL